MLRRESTGRGQSLAELFRPYAWMPQTGLLDTSNQLNVQQGLGKSRSADRVQPSGIAACLLVS